MSDDHQAARERLFWDRYTRRVHDQGIKPPFDQWHARRAKAFIGQFPGRRLGELAAQEVTDYLTRVGHEAALKPWQFRQLVDAIRILYSMVRAEWAAGFDWDFWMASARTVGSQHASRARESAPVEPTEFAERLGDTRFAPLIRAHLELFASVATAIRVRNMAFRTEQTSMHWMCRFMLHHGGQSPSHLGAAEVAGFLQYLAAERNVAASTQNQALYKRR